MAQHLMSENELIAVLREMHKPDCEGDSMVWEVWNDGEVTLTKGGELYGQRTLHMQAAGDMGLALPAKSLFPRFNHSRIIVATHEEAMGARGLIFGEAAD